MDGKQKAYHHGDLRSEIERIAWDKVTRDGAEKLSLRACARDAGVDPAAVYRHFRSKDDILMALARKAFVALAASMSAVKADVAGADPEEGLLAIGQAYVDYALAEPQIFAMMFDVAGRLPMQAEGHAPGPDENAYAILQAAWAAVVPGQSPDAADAATFTLWSAVHGLSALFNTNLGPVEMAARRARARAVCETVLRGCVETARKTG